MQEQAQLGAALNSDGRLAPFSNERHARIHGAAVRAARAAGWSGERELEDDR